MEFEGPGFTDDSLRAMRNLDGIQMLALWDTAVTDKGCRELLRASALVEASITSDTLSGHVLEILAQLPALRSLQIHRGPKIGDDGLRYLRGCVGLRELYLKETAVTDRGLIEIGKLPQVWSLMLHDTAISDEGCAALAGMQQLSLLGLMRTRVAGHGLAALRDNEHFSINLDNTPATDEGVIALAQRLSNLKSISLDETGVGDSAARALAKLPHLDFVKLSHTKVTDEGLSAFSGHPSLELIGIKGCAISQRVVKALKKAAPRPLYVHGP
jgi:hypothetical protein